MSIDEYRYLAVWRGVKIDYGLFFYKNPNEYCMLVALPCGQDHLDIIMQSNNLRAGFINYLQQKQAAGIVNIVDPITSQVPCFLCIPRSDLNFIVRGTCW